MVQIDGILVSSLADIKPMLDLAEDRPVAFTVRLPAFGSVKAGREESGTLGESCRKACAAACGHGPGVFIGSIVLMCWLVARLAGWLDDRVTLLMDDGGNSMGS